MVCLLLRYRNQNHFVSLCGSVVVAYSSGLVSPGSNADLTVLFNIVFPNVGKLHILQCGCGLSADLLKGSRMSRTLEKSKLVESLITSLGTSKSLGR